MSHVAARELDLSWCKPDHVYVYNYTGGALPISRDEIAIDPVPISRRAFARLMFPWRTPGSIGTRAPSVFYRC